MVWFYLVLAILFEVGGTTLLKMSNGFEQLPIGIASLACYGTSLTLLGLALKVLPVGVAYAIWCGVGIVAVVIIGILFSNESITAFKFACFVMIAAGSVGLALVTVRKSSCSMAVVGV